MTRKMFTPETVATIRQRYKDDHSLTYESLAAEYRVSPLTINLLIRGKTWKQVPGAMPNNRGRGIRRGPDHPQAKLSIPQVREMVHRYDSDPTLTYDSLAEERGVSRRVIAHAFRNLDQWLAPEELAGRVSTRVRGARRGQLHPSAHLTDREIAQMRQLRQEDRTAWTLSKLSEKFGTCPSMVSRVVRGKSRKDAGGPIEGKVRDQLTEFPAEWDARGKSHPFRVLQSVGYRPGDGDGSYADFIAAVTTGGQPAQKVS